MGGQAPKWPLALGGSGPVGPTEVDPQPKQQSIGSAAVVELAVVGNRQDTHSQHTDGPRYICSNRPHLVHAMRSNNDKNNQFILLHDVFESTNRPKHHPFQVSPFRNFSAASLRRWFEITVGVITVK